MDHRRSPEFASPDRKRRRISPTLTFGATAFQSKRPKLKPLNESSDEDVDMTALRKNSQERTALQTGKLNPAIRFTEEIRSTERRQRQVTPQRLDMTDAEMEVSYEGIASAQQLQKASDFFKQPLRFEDDECEFKEIA